MLSSESEIWSVPLENNEKITLEIADTDRDGIDEVGVTSAVDRGPTSYGILDQGKWVWKESSSADIQAPTSGDIDGDGNPEIIFKAKVGPIWVRPYKHNGSYLWTGEMPDWPGSAIAIDYDNDGKDEVASLSGYYGYFRVFDDDGSVVWDIQSNPLVDKLLDFRNVTEGNMPDLLTPTGQSAKNTGTGLQLVRRNGKNDAVRVWEYGPTERVKARFVDLNGDGSKEVLAVYPGKGEVHAVDTDGTQIWAESLSVSGGRAAILDTAGNDTLNVVLWSGTDVAVLDSSTQTVNSFVTESPVQRVEPFADGQMIVVTDAGIGVATPKSGIEQSTSTSRDVLNVAAGDVDGDGNTELVIGFTDEIVAVSNLARSEDPESTSTPTPTTSQPRVTPTPESPKPTPTTTIASSEYDLRSAGGSQTVEIRGTTYRILWDIPEASDRFAVVTNGYKLVDAELTRSALVAYTWEGTAWPANWNNELATLKSLRKSAADNRLFGRALDLGWDLTEILVYTSVGMPNSAVGPILDIGLDTLTWGIEDAQRPYRKAFQRMIATLGNTRAIENAAGDVVGYSSLGDSLAASIGAAMSLKSAVDRGVDLGVAITSYYRALTATDLFTKAVNSKVAALKLSEAPRLLADFAFGLGVWEMESTIKAKTQIHGITHAYATVGIPVVKSLATLEERIRGGEATIGDVIVYKHYVEAYYQLSAVLFTAASELWQGISNRVTGAIWDVLAGAQQKSDAHRRTAESMKSALNYVQLSYGRGWSLVRNRTNQSINAEELGAVIW